MDLIGKIDQTLSGKKEPASEQSVQEVLTMINEIAQSYGALVDTVDKVIKQNVVLRSKVMWLEEHVAFLLAKDPEYVEHAEKVLKEQQELAAKEGNDDQGNSVSTVLPS